MGQGSQVEYISQSERSNRPSFWEAFLMASISACAVGSLVAITRLWALAITFPRQAITAPNGPPALLLIPKKASFMANCMKRLIMFSSYHIEKKNDIPGLFFKSPGLR
jgi:hypothetical protein